MRRGCRMADSSGGTEATMAMLRKLLQRLPKGALCDLIDCQYHKHPEYGAPAPCVAAIACQ